MKKNITGILGDVLQFNKNGPKIKSNEDTFEFWNNTETEKIPLDAKNTYPETVVMTHDRATINSGSGLDIIIHSGCVGNFYAEQNPGVSGDEFQQSFFLKKGTYKFLVMGRKKAGKGKIDWYVDDTLIVTGQDWYNASEVNNVVQSHSSITILTSGNHILKGKTNGKNASSSGYIISLNKYWFEV